MSTKSPIGGGQLDRRLAGQQAERAAARLVADRGQPRLAEIGDAAVQHDPLDVEDTDQAGDRLAEVATGRHDDPAGLLVAGLERGPDVVEGAARRSWPARCPSRDVGMLACELGRALRRSPASWPPSRGSRTGRSGIGAVLFDDRVADLAGAEAVAVEQLATEDDAGADASPDLDRDEVRRAGWSARSLNSWMARAAARLSLASSTGTPYRSRRRSPSGRSCQSRLTAQRIVPVVGVDDARRADADAQQRARPRSPASSSMSSWTSARARSPSRPSTGRSTTRLDLAAEVDDRRPERLLAEVEGDHVASVVDELEEDRRLAAGRRPAARPRAPGRPR